MHRSAAEDGQASDWGKEQPSEQSRSLPHTFFSLAPVHCDPMARLGFRILLVLEGSSWALGRESDLWLVHPRR